MAIKLLIYKSFFVFLICESSWILNMMMRGKGKGHIGSLIRNVRTGITEQDNEDNTHA
jgi:hypothetical protein